MIFCKTGIVVATTILLLHTQTRRSIMDANVRNIEKRLDALERMQTMTMKPPIANVGTLGLWAFALTTAMLSVKELRVGASDDGAVGVTIGFAFGFGGLVQLLAGILSALRGQSFSAVAFASYGGFWLSYGTYEVLAYEAVIPRDKVAEEAMLFMWGFLTLVLFCASLNTNVAISSLFFTLAALFFLLGGAKDSGSSALKLVASLFGVGVSIIAFYAGAGELINEQYGKTIIPLGRFEHTHEGVDRSFNEPRVRRAPLRDLPK